MKKQRASCVGVKKIYDTTPEKYTAPNVPKHLIEAKQAYEACKDVVDWGEVIFTTDREERGGDGSSDRHHYLRDSNHCAEGFLAGGRGGYADQQQWEFHLESRLEGEYAIE